jgi:hypothetical protein
MPTFRYSAYGIQGDFAEGTIDAASPDVASQLLWSQGLTPFQMETVHDAAVRWWQRELFPRWQNSRGELAPFTREFATLMAADIPLDDALRIVCDQANSAPMTRIAKELRADVLNGVALSDAMQNQAPRRTYARQLRPATVCSRSAIGRLRSLPATSRPRYPAVADPFQRASVFELLQQLEIVVAGNAEQMPDTSLLETAKQKVADLHS